MATSRPGGGSTDGRTTDRLPVVTDGAAYCQCGELLLDDIDDMTVVVKGERIPYRRTTDHVGCDNCRYSYPVWVVRAAIGADDATTPPTA